MGHIPSNMEWGGDDVGGHPSGVGRVDNLGCIWVMGVWGIHLNRGVVPVEAA